MHIVVAGGSGFIGRHLVPALLADGHTVTVLTRTLPAQRVTPEGVLRYVYWNPIKSDDGLAAVLANTDAVINLAGANIGSRRWTARRKADLLNSRIHTTETLLRAIDHIDTKSRPQTLINASGIDFYGDRNNEVLTESSLPGDTFLAQLCQRWEQAATAAETLGMRVVLMRTAVVLAPDALTFHLLAWPFRLFIGGPLGDGQQWFPWVHIDDVVNLYKWALNTNSISGPVNVVSPDIGTQIQVARTFGMVLRRPSRLQTPAPILRLVMGEQADLLLHGRRAIPEVASTQGYVFRFSELTAALQNCLQHGNAERSTPLSVELHSPFFPVLGGAGDEVPEVLRTQYLVRPGDTHRVVLEGTMDRIWHRPFWLWPFFRLLAIFNILFPEQGSNIEASMIVEGCHDRQGGSAQTWHRAFQFRKQRRSFNATMAFDFRLARVVEWMGPGSILQVIWNVTFEPPVTIRIITEGIQLGFGRYRITLPRWAAVEIHVSEIALSNRSDTIAVDLTVRHQWLGEIFGYTGHFQLRKELKENQGS